MADAFYRAVRLSADEYGGVVDGAINSQAMDMPPERAGMLISRIRAQFGELHGRTELSGRVMAAMGRGPAESVRAPAFRHRAYENAPLPIEAG